MAKRVIFKDAFRHSIQIFGAVVTPMALIDYIYGFNLPAYFWIGLAMICLLVGTLWTSVEDRRRYIQEAEENFLKKRPEFRDYRYLWKLHGLLAQGKSYHGAAGMTPERFTEWKIEVRKLLEEWGEEKSKSYHLNLPPHADLPTHISKLQQVLDDETCPLG